MVELNSEEDSDVIIVETEIKEEHSSSEQPPIPTTSLNTKHLYKPSTSKRRRNTVDNTETVKLTENTEENTNDVPSTLTRRKRRHQANDDNGHGDGEGPSRIKMIIRSDPQSVLYSSTITTGALLGDGANATMSQTNASFVDDSGPSTSVIRQPFNARNIPFRKKKYTIYDASSESSDLDSTDSSISSDSSHEECKPLKQKRLTKKQSRKTLKMQNKQKILAKSLQMKIKMNQMMKRLKEGKGVVGRCNISSSSNSTSSSSSDVTTSMDEEEKESSSEYIC